MRLFVGIPLVAAVAEELAKLAARLRRKDDGLRWSAAESWHITLQFLGSVDEQRYGCVLERLGEVRFAPVPVAVEGVGAFDRAGVFFADVRVTPELHALQQRVAAAMEHCGFVPEARPYHPHITLARSKGKDGAPGLRSLKAQVQRELKFGGFVADEFVLYESVPEPGGSRYVILERFALGKIG
jgi:2'-5' RNA ligase